MNLQSNWVTRPYNIMLSILYTLNLSTVNLFNDHLIFYNFILIYYVDQTKTSTKRSP